MTVRRGIKFQVQQRIDANRNRVQEARAAEEREREAIKQLNRQSDRTTKENEG